ncbi:aspartate aminotransferase family protein [Acrocarpospora macrocephala]|nr:aminotransferase class III-fold pyridoxal phosphate-dependent enzyme [Acrocarpospora macrocephala]
MRAAMRPHPLFVERASGAHVWDLDGDRYIDYVMGWGPLVLGHGNAHVLNAVSDAMKSMQLVGTGHLGEILAAEAVLEAVPHAERLLWSNTGTEAIQVALRLARAATGRQRVVKFIRCYHGWHDSVLASLSDTDSGQEAVPASKGQSPAALQDLITAGFNDVEQIAEILSAARDRDIAAVVLDPIMSNAGLEAARPEFLATIRRLCDEHGVVLIFDEVITGFRLARGGAAEYCGVQPDLSVFGKAMAGGFTQSAVAGRADLIDEVTRGVVHAGTFNSNPIAMAAVKATMEALAEGFVYERLEAAGLAFERTVGPALAAAPRPATLNRVGSLLQIIPSAGYGATNGSDPQWNRFVGSLLSEGVMITPSGKAFVSVAHTEEDFEVTAEAVGSALASD